MMGEGGPVFFVCACICVIKDTIMGASPHPPFPLWTMAIFFSSSVDDTCVAFWSVGTRRNLAIFFFFTGRESQKDKEEKG